MKEDKSRRHVRWRRGIDYKDRMGLRRTGIADSSVASQLIVSIISISYTVEG